MINEPSAKKSDTGPNAVEDEDHISIQLERYRRRLTEAERELAEYESIVTRLSQAALQAELLEIELRQIFNSTGDGMWVIDRNQRVQRINERMLRLLGKTREQVIGQKCHEFLKTHLCRTAACPMARMKKNGRQVECDIQSVNAETGNTHYFILTASPFSGLDGQLIGIVAGLKDITARKEGEKAIRGLNEKLSRQANIDGLTQVANRRHLDEMLNREWERHKRERQPLGVIMCDIDHFKLYNDRYGHQKGDDCLREVALAIRKELRRPGDFLGRYGGEEFVVILSNTHAEGARQKAESIRKSVQNLSIRHKDSPTHPHVTLSVGSLSVIPGSENSAEMIVKGVDKGLYEAKSQGRNRVVHTALEKRT